MYHLRPSRSRKSELIVLNFEVLEGLKVLLRLGHDVNALPAA